MKESIGHPFGRRCPIILFISFHVVIPCGLTWLGKNISFRSDAWVTMHQHAHSGFVISLRDINLAFDNTVSVFNITDLNRVNDIVDPSVKLSAFFAGILGFDLIAEFVFILLLCAIHQFDHSCRDIFLRVTHSHHRREAFSTAHKYSHAAFRYQSHPCRHYGRYKQNRR